MVVGMYGGKFLPLHMGHVSCIIEASGLCDVLYLVLSHSEKRDKQLCKNDNFEYVNYEKRLQWLDQIASDLPNVKVIHIEDTDDIEYRSWSDGAKSVIRQISEKRIDLVFGSEVEYRDTFEKIYLNSRYVLLDPDRRKWGVSSTQIRRNGVFSNWEFIPNICKPYYNKKVVVVGTESCGKSTIVKKLAMYYNTNYVSEYGREMCDLLNTGQPTKEYYPYIAYGQKVREFEMIQKSNKLLIIDTDSTVTQYYAELYAKTKFDVLDEISKANDYDLTIFLEPDVEWVDDGLRLHGSEEDRYQNNKTLKKMLRSSRTRYISVSGSYSERFKGCVSLIDEILK